uniref:RILP-like protein 1 n=1 Tax=Pyxicephalus adspersus TaxID=30357 RepID=A0AAV3A217_PYXAD|nr:TPA: hypothetical protein GDO54_014124 [Pyxicephalus adspersus]
MEGMSALEKNVAELTVMDVYDIASAVGQEFERVIDQYGCEAIGRLMPKVVRVLEILEVLVSRNNINPEMEELRLELDRLRLERMDRIEKEKKHQKCIHKVQALQTVQYHHLFGYTNIVLFYCIHKVQQLQSMSERERQVMKKLKEVVDKQRDEIRAKDRELVLKNEDVEALQQQQSRLMKINHDLRHRITVVEAQGKSLIEQKVELEAYLQAKEQEATNMKLEIGKLRERLKGEQLQNGEEKKEPTEAITEDPLFDSDKTLFDLKDSNRPRFTLQELRDVLHERNELKAKVFMLQEELAYYKSEEAEEETKLPQTPPIIHSKAPNPQESGIKRLFSFFSRDKRRMPLQQKNATFQESFGVWSDYNREDGYTEQGQEALQHM